MIIHTVSTCRTGLVPGLSRFVSFRGISRLLALLLLAGTLMAQANEPDDEYLGVMALIDAGDALHKGNKPDAAKAKYQEAQAALLKLRKEHRNWNARLVSGRLSYLTEKIAELSPRAVPAEERGVIAPTAPRPTGPQVKLLAAGTEPRQALRLNPKTGEKQSVTMTAKTTVTVESAGVPAQPMSMPGIKMTLSLLPKSLSTEGIIEFELAFGEIEIVGGEGIPPQVADAIKVSMSGMKGLVLRGAMTDRGFSKKVEVTLPPGADPATRKLMEEMKDSVAETKFILPEEPVGAGAKWEVKNRIKPQGVTIDTTTTYELVSNDGGVLTIRSAVRQTAAVQKIPHPFLAGTNADLTKYAANGTESLTLDLAKAFPTQQSVETHEEKSLVIDVAGQRQLMTMKTDTIVRVEPK